MSSMSDLGGLQELQNRGKGGHLSLCRSAGRFPVLSERVCVQT